MTERFNQKTIPAGNRSSRMVDRPPDAPRIETNSCNLTKRRKGRTITQRVEYPIPLLPHKELGIGGKRAIGGGTSKEAVRRAKRQAKRSNKRTPLTSIN